MSAGWAVRPLFNPGPVGLSPAVREALRWPEIGHRDPDFLRVFHEVRDLLADVHRDLTRGSHDVIAFAGSGASAVDAVVLDAASSGGTTLVLVGGPYGERMQQTLSAVGMPVRAVAIRPGESVRRALSAALVPGVRRVAAVHHDTATATLLDLPELVEVCLEHELDLVVDAVSSFGCEEIPAAPGLRSWWATCSNKALEAAPGLAVCARPRDLPGTRPSRAPITLDLGVHAAHQTAGSTAYTLPTQVVASLRVALGELVAEGGWKGRHRRYAATSGLLRDGLRRLGLGPVELGGAASSCLTLAQLPAGLTYEELSERLPTPLRVYAAQGELAGTHFRVGVMGSVTHDDVRALVSALAQVAT